MSGSLVTWHAVARPRGRLCKLRMRLPAQDWPRIQTQQARLLRSQLRVLLSRCSAVDRPVSGGSAQPLPGASVPTGPWRSGPPSALSASRPAQPPSAHT
eukprot:3128481-Rhodomonas_salina.4